LSGLTAKIDRYCHQCNNAPVTAFSSTKSLSREKRNEILVILAFFSVVFTIVAVYYFYQPGQMFVQYLFNLLIGFVVTMASIGGIGYFATWIGIDEALLHDLAQYPTLHKTVILVSLMISGGFIIYKLTQPMIENILRHYNHGNSTSTSY